MSKTKDIELRQALEAQAKENAELSEQLTHLRDSYLVDQEQAAHNRGLSYQLACALERNAILVNEHDQLTAQVDRQKGELRALNGEIHRLWIENAELKARAVRAEELLAQAREKATRALDRARESEESLEGARQGATAELLGALCREAHVTAREKGFHDHALRCSAEWATPAGRDRLLALLALIHSEVSEATEEVRDLGWAWPLVRYTDDKPEGLLAELADVVIRVWDMVGLLGQSEEFLPIVLDKMAYNRSRPRKHGREA